MRLAIINRDGIVANAVEVADDWPNAEAGHHHWEPPTGSLAVPSDEAGIGWTYDGEKFTAPEVAKPPGE